MPCPSCGIAMDQGDVVSSTRVNWRSYTISTMKRIFSQGHRIGKTKWGLGYRIPAFHCEQCRLFMIR
ncbi:PF20097 family protein [Rubripirellula obstinata]|uniref:PF20097 family protein n=1 Tax=Rubripirellula obstinata TaxID=406547 RepID=UPI003B833886